MAKKNKQSGKISSTTQGYLDISEVRDNTVVLRDGSLRSVLLASSINFALKSEEEQKALISGYVSFLNNINFVLQIIVQSRELNISGYLDYLKEKEKKQSNKLLKMQTAEYIDYVKELTQIGKIMNKKFYIVVPYSPFSDSSKRKNFFQLVGEALKPATSIRLQDEKFNRYREGLNRRVSSVRQGLASLGVKTVELDTQSLIELYYKTYNPTTSKNQELTDLKNLRVER